METRVQRLAATLDREGVDAFLAWSPTATGYLANFWEHPHRRFSTLAVSASGQTAMILPSLGRTTAEEAGISDVRPWTDSEDPLALFGALADEWDLKGGIIAVEGDLPSRMLLAMQSALPAALFREGDALLAELRRRKEGFELELMKQAGEIVDAVYTEILPFLQPGRTEAEVAAELRRGMRNRGMEPAFWIVAGGPNSAKPHHAPGERPLAAGEVVLLDFGGAFERYGADITRVVHLGAAPQKVKETYAAVYGASETARLGIRPGTTGAEADSLARDVLVAEGLGDLFVHRLGHGIGLAEHEAPYLVATNQDPLVVGDCFTIEPGVYRPGEFGVRLENTYTLEEAGPRSMNEPFAAEILELKIG